MSIVFTIIGILLILVALQDVFHTLFHPAKAGDISDAIARYIWRLFRGVAPGALTLAGPLAFVTTPSSTTSITWT